MIPAPVLLELYEIQMLSASEIGDLIGTTKSVILKHLRKNGIQRRLNVDAIRVSSKRASNLLKGPTCPWWKGGRKSHTGYQMVMCPGHPEANRFGYVFEHRLVAEGMLERYLTKEEVVHHINENRKDNRP